MLEHAPANSSEIFIHQLWPLTVLASVQFIVAFDDVLRLWLMPVVNRRADRSGAGATILGALIPATAGAELHHSHSIINLRRNPSPAHLAPDNICDDTGYLAGRKYP